MNKQNAPQIDVADMDSFLKRASHLYHIRSEDREIIPFKLNHPQQQLHEIVLDEKERTKKVYGHEQVKIVVLKGRQLGISTYYAVSQLDAMTIYPNYELQVLAHDAITTQKLYDIYKRAYRYIPDVVDLVGADGKVLQENYKIKPDTISLSGKKMRFKGLESTLSVQTAGGGDNVGKGGNLSSIHFSEMANVEEAKTVLSFISQALPRNGDIFSMIESTANGVSGVGEEFYKLWERSVRAWDKYESGETKYFDGYRPVFLGWYDHPKYTFPLRDGKMIDLEGIDFGSEGRRGYEEKEEFMADSLNLSLEQINWYRWCIKNKCSYDLMDAYRYYPTVPNDAFKATDICYFNTEELFRVKTNLKSKKESEPYIGYVDEDFEFVEDKSDYLTIYEFPDTQYENRYVLGIDPSKNVEGGDYGVIEVFDRLKQEYVAKWYGRIEEDELAIIAMNIGYFYGGAMIIPEENLSTLMNIIKPTGLMPYKGEIYYRVSGNDTKWGFHTDKNSRKILLEKYKIWLRNNYDSINDLSELNEHVNFIKKRVHGVVKPEHADGEHDDQVFSRALCVFGSDWWDEDVAKINDEGTDYEKIFKIESSVKRGKKQNRLGHRGRAYSFPKATGTGGIISHTKLGR